MNPAVLPRLPAPPPGQGAAPPPPQAAVSAQPPSQLLPLVARHHGAFRDIQGVAVPYNSLAKRRQTAKAFVDNLLSAKIAPIPGSNGMRIMSDTIDFESGRCGRNVVLRSSTESFWEVCVQQLLITNRRVCAVGSPGIGKTTTTPFLIRRLLERQQTVVYHIRRPAGQEFVYEFIPTTSGVAVNVYPSPDSIPSLEEPSTYYIVDPGKTQDSCDPPTDFVAKVLIVASPDSTHWGGNEFTKERGNVEGTFRYLPLWDLDELLHAREFMRHELTEKQVIERFRLFGGVPRHVFASDEAFHDALIKQNNAANDLNENQVLRMVRNNIADTVTMDSSQPQIALMGYKIANNNYAKRIPVFISVAAAEKVSARHISALWQTIVFGEHEGRNVFESYTRNLMANGLLHTLQARLGKSLRKPSRRRGPLTTKFAVTVGGCSEIRLVVDVTEVCKTQEHHILYHSVDRYYALIDFMYRDTKGNFHAFQVTVEDKHSADVAAIKNLEQAVGGAEKLTLYYLVPDRKYDRFVTDPVNPTDLGATCVIYHVMIPDPSLNRRKHNP